MSQKQAGKFRGPQQSEDSESSGRAAATQINAGARITKQEDPPQIVSDPRFRTLQHNTRTGFSIDKRRNRLLTKDVQMRITYRSAQGLPRRKNDEASQELFFACVSFVVLLGAALADVVFHI